MSGFTAGLLGARCALDLDGTVTTLPTTRWHGDPDRADRLMLDRCAGPTLDVGCGPGRLTAALPVALGIDVNPVAVALTRARGGQALCRDVYEQVPGEGRWHHVLLADGNIGIGGAPARLLRRVRDLLAPGGTALVETDHPGAGLRAGRASVGGGPCFRWAIVGVERLPALALGAGLVHRWTGTRSGRWFTELARP